MHCPGLRPARTGGGYASCVRTFPRLAFAAAVATVLTLTACGSSQPPTKPSARSLEAKIPGCAHTSPDPAGATVYTRQETACQTPDGTMVEIATFVSQGDERSWITSWGGYGACCLEGHGWAATVDSPRPSPSTSRMTSSSATPTGTFHGRDTDHHPQA